MQCAPACRFPANRPIAGQVRENFCGGDTASRTALAKAGSAIDLPGRGVASIVGSPSASPAS
jgi:hypothetical protein